MKGGSKDRSEDLWHTDGSSSLLDGKRRAGYAVVSNFETTEAKPLPPGTSAQLAELIALTQALELGKGKRIAILDSFSLFSLPNKFKVNKKTC